MSEEQYNEILSRLGALETDVGELKIAYQELCGISTTDAACHCTYEVDKASILSRISNIQASLDAAEDDTSWEALIKEIKEVILPDLEERLKQYSDTNRDALVEAINTLSDNVGSTIDSIANNEREITSTKMKVTGAVSGAGVVIETEENTRISKIANMELTGTTLTIEN